MFEKYVHLSFAWYLEILCSKSEQIRESQSLQKQSGKCMEIVVAREKTERSASSEQEDANFKHRFANTSLVNDS